MVTRVFLIGLMGCGKTTVGRRLGAALGVPYVDNDLSVAARAGVDTVELARRGGTELHELEARYAAALVERDGSFVAGVAASSADRPDDLDALDAAGLLVYLRCPPDVLTARVVADPPRPWLPPDPTALIAATYVARDPALSRHGLVVDGTAAPERTVDLVCAQLRERARLLSGPDAS